MRASLRTGDATAQRRLILTGTSAPIPMGPAPESVSLESPPSLSMRSASATGACSVPACAHHCISTTTVRRRAVGPTALLHPSKAAARSRYRVPCNSGAPAVIARTRGALLLSCTQASVAEFRRETLAPGMEAVAQTGPQSGASMSRGITVLGSAPNRCPSGTTPRRQSNSVVSVPPLHEQPLLDCLRNGLDDQQS